MYIGKINNCSIKRNKPFGVEKYNKSNTNNSNVGNTNLLKIIELKNAQNSNKEILKTDVIKTDVIKKDGVKKDNLTKGLLIGAGVLVALGTICFCKKLPKKIPNVSQNLGGTLKPNSYRQSLLEGLNKTFGTNFAPNSLDSVLDKNEFLKVISSLKEENYVLTPENIKKGIFRADLHSHSNFSDGLGDVGELLNQVAKYADSLYEKTNNKFLFSLTDHDGVNGVIEMLKRIATEPKKFKNVQFVTGSELSFAMVTDKTANPTETSELLAYCFNPFDNKVKKYFSNLSEKRKQVINHGIEQLKKTFPNVIFSPEEFSRTYSTDMTNHMFEMNLHWRVHHYGQTKYAIYQMAQNKGVNPETLYDEIMKKAGKQRALGNLKDLGLIPSHINENDLIVNIRNKIQPQINAGEITDGMCESTIPLIFEGFKEQDCIFSFAHPYYIAERLRKPIEFINNVIEKSNGKLKLTESYHQAYNPTVNMSEVKNLNSVIETFGLIPIGGRDNHQHNFFSHM